MADLLDTPRAGRAAARGATVRVAGHVAGVGISAVAAALLFRYLGVADAGRYVAAVSLAAVAVQIADAGLTGLATRELAKTGDDGRGLLSDLLGVRLVFGGAGVALAALAAAALGWSAPLVAGTALAATGVLLLAVAHNVGALLGSRLRWGAVASVELARNAAGAVAVAALVLAGAGLTALLASHVVAGLAALALVLALTRHRALPAARRGLGRWRAEMRHLLPLALAMAAVVVYLRAAMILTAAIASAAEAGLFAAAYRVTEVLATIPALAAGAFLPLLARAAVSDLHRHAATARRTVRNVGLLGLGMAAATALAAPLLIAAVAGPGFTGSVPALRVAGLALGIACLNAGLAVTLLSLELHRDMLATALAGLAALTLAMLVLTPAHGAVGSALAMVIGELSWLAVAATTVARRGVLRHPVPVPA